jgi:hypothetical protein
METRRTIIRTVGLTMAGGLAWTGLMPARASEAVFPGKPTDDTPKATVIKATPPILDFGDGLKIPCDKSAFLTLWEGKTFWLTFGAGRAIYAERAQGEAVLYALGAMKLLLMTLAFAPERLVQTDGGWRLKVQDVNNYVLGDIQLPGKPYWPINDTGFAVDGFAGAGDTSSSALNAPPTPPSTLNPNTSAWDPTLSSNKVNAYTTYILLKRDVSLDYVRSHAQIVLY